MKKFLFFIIALVLLNHLVYNLLVNYTEKTSFIWSQISNRNIEQKEYDYLILGDSQIMSGIHPQILNDLFLSKKSILYFPRPSEQAEGIFLLLIEFYKKGFRFKRIILNISPVTTSKNNIVDSHKTLMTNFNNFNPELIFNLEMNKFYLKNFSGNIYYLIIQVFPLLKLNSNFVNEIALVPKIEGQSNSSNIEMYLTQNLFGNLKYNYEKNIFLKTELEKEGFYFEWGNFTNTNKSCIPNDKEKKLPVGIELAFSNSRLKAFENWLKTIELSKQNSSEIIFLYLPFAPETEEKISILEDRPILNLINKIRETNPQTKIIEFDKSFFIKTDFGDFTHLNRCGMNKLTKELAYRLNNLQ